MCSLYTEKIGLFYCFNSTELQQHLRKRKLKAWINPLIYNFGFKVFHKALQMFCL